MSTESKEVQAGRSEEQAALWGLLRTYFDESKARMEAQGQLQPPGWGNRATTIGWAAVAVSLAAGALMLGLVAMHAPTWALIMQATVWGVTVLGTCGFMIDLARKYSRAIKVDQPRLALISMAEIRCPACHEPLQNDDIVVWSERREGYRSDMVHAHCVVIVRKADGATTKIDGSPVVLGALKAALTDLKMDFPLVLPEKDWAELKATAKRPAAAPPEATAP